MEDPYKRIQVEVNESVARTNALPNKITGLLTKLLLCSLVLCVIIGVVIVCSSHQATHTTQGDPKFVRMEVAATPEWWNKPTTIPYGSTNILVYPKNTARSDYRYWRRINGDDSKVAGPLVVSDTDKMGAFVSSIEVKSGERFPIVMVIEYERPP